MALLVIPALIFHALPMPVCGLKPNVLQMCCSLILAIKILHIALHKHTNKQMLLCNAEGYGCKTHLPDSEDSNTMAPWAESYITSILCPLGECGKCWIHTHTKI
jgi:hypothetical protein